MREIKYRAWDEDGRMIYPPFDLKLINNPAGDVMLIESDGTFGYHGSSIRLMQYTGLKDRNGTEIYEGDILKDDKGQIGKVFWQDSRLHYAVNWLMKDGSYETDNCLEYGVVIGNVYENPELVK